MLVCVCVCVLERAEERERARAERACECVGDTARLTLVPPKLDLQLF